MTDHSYARAIRLSRRRALALFGGVAGAGLLACTKGDGDKSADHTAMTAPTPDGGTAQPTDFSARFAQFEPADEPNGDLSKVVWPAFILRGPPEVKRLYEFQVMNGDLMRYMPCFCGCQWEDNHRSNRDCYIDTVNPDGSVVFDNMAPT